jgi:hypothetical protein
MNLFLVLRDLKFGLCRQEMQPQDREEMRKGR